MATNSNKPPVAAPQKRADIPKTRSIDTSAIESIPISFNEEAFTKRIKSGATGETVMRSYSAYYPNNKKANGLIRQGRQRPTKVSFEKIRKQPREMLVRYGVFQFFKWESKEHQEKFLKISRLEAREMDQNDPQLK